MSAFYNLYSNKKPRLKAGVFYHRIILPAIMPAVAHAPAN